MKNLDAKIHEIGEWLGSGTLNFFGKPFAGKDTNADRLNKFLGGIKLSSGQILREAEIPEDVRAEMNNGKLIESDRFRDYVFPVLGQAAFAGKPLFLSSVGRVSGEEEGVLLATEASGHPTMAVPYLDITRDESFRRLKDQPDRGRDDDGPEKLAVRIDEFLAKTEPVLTFYEKKGLLVPINAMPEEDMVFRIMVEMLHERAMAA